MENAYTKIFLRDISASVRIGLLDWEHEKPQRISVSVELYVQAGDYLKNVTPRSIVDYAPIYELVRGWEARAQTPLIETFVRELQEACFGFESVQACRVSVSKPDVFEHAAAAGVEAFISREQFQKLSS